MESSRTAVWFMFGDLRVSCAARTAEEVREKCGRLTWHCRQRASNKVDVRQILTTVRVRPAPGLIERHSLTFVMPFNKKRLYRDTRADYFELRWQFCTSPQRQPLPEVKFCWCWDWKWSKVSDDLEYRQVNGLKQRHIKTTEIIVKKILPVYTACKNDMECYHKLGQQNQKMILLCSTSL